MWPLPKITAKNNLFVIKHTHLIPYKKGLSKFGGKFDRTFDTPFVMI